MWCVHCRQDVPALPASDTQELRCPRCGETLCADPKDSAGQLAGEGPEAPSAPTALPSYDGWETDEQLRHIERVLQTAKARGRQLEAAYRREAARYDLPHAGPHARHVPPTDKPGRRRKANPTGRGAVAGLCTWSALLLGTTSLVCGGILLGWSMATGRQELWTIGLPVALIGQVALLIGLVLQLDRLWHDNREAAAKLDNVDEQLHELKATTTLLGTSHGPASSVFYAHLAGGAGPQRLLTDLKSQIDLLAMKMSQEER